MSDLAKPLEAVFDYSARLHSRPGRRLLSRTRAAIKVSRPSWTFSHPILVLSTMAPSTGATASTSALPQPLASTPVEPGATGTATDRPELAMRSAAGTSSGSEPLHSSAADDAPVGLASQDTVVGDDPHTVDTKLEHIHSTSRDFFRRFLSKSRAYVVQRAIVADARKSLQSFPKTICRSSSLRTYHPDWAPSLPQRQRRPPSPRADISTDHPSQDLAVDVSRRP